MLNRKRNNPIITDIVCQVLVKTKSKDLIYSVLNEFIPNYCKLNLDYTGKPDNMDYIFQSEDEMITCYTETPNVEQTFYWNREENDITVGANITNDDQIVFSLTFRGTEDDKANMYLRLKKFLNANIGVISYVDPAYYENGSDFERQFRDTLYDFEK